MLCFLAVNNVLLYCLGTWWVWGTTLAANKKYQIYAECTCGCLHKLISDEPEMKWKEAENRVEEDKLALDLSGGQESVKENRLEIGLGKQKRWTWSVLVFIQRGS